MGAAAVAGATLASGALAAGSQIIGSNKAAGAANKAADIQLQIAQMNQARLAPFVQAGTDVLPQLAGAQPGTETLAQLEATPGYQFILDQGLKSTQNAVAARGLGVSGAAMKGAANYATGLAQNTYQNIFNQQQQKFQNLLNIATLGANAGAQTGTQSIQSAGNAGNALIQAGNLQGSGLINAGNALTGSANNALGYYQLQNLLNPQTQGQTPTAQPGPNTVGYF